MHTISNDNHGFTLIEVLVAVFVLAFGAIAVAAMQLTAMRTAQDANLQSTAVRMASEMSDIMRSIPMTKNDHDSPFLFSYSSDRQQASAGLMTCYDKQQCSNEQLAAFMIHDWQSRLATALPGAHVVICRDSTPWNKGPAQFRWECDNHKDANMVIKIGWDGRGHNPDGTLARAAKIPPALALIVEPVIEAYLHP